MFDAESFDVEYIVIGKTFAKSAGIVSEREVQSLFNALEGRKNLDWHFVHNGVNVQWSDRWNVVDQSKSHSAFRVMPIASIPRAVLAERLAQFSAMRSKPIIRSDMTDGWFDKHAKRQSDENDAGFEHRMVKTLVAVFTAISIYKIGGKNENPSI
jgi:hypothetical protein